MEFTRDLLMRLERNAQSARNLTKEQAQQELDRIYQIGRTPTGNTGAIQGGSRQPGVDQHHRPKAP